MELQGRGAFAILFLTWLVLFPGIEFYNAGQTIGKALFKVKTVRDDFTDLNFRSALIRHLCDLLDYLPFFGITGLLVTSNNKYKQRIGDLVAKTVVIDATYDAPAHKYP